jgi:transmembrane sensor
MTPKPRAPQSPRPDDAAILRYVSGESTLAESEAIREWLEANADLAASVDELRAAWSAPASPEVKWDKGAMWHRIAAETRPSRRQNEGSRLTMYAIAASITLLIGAASTVVYLRARAPVAEQVTWRDVETKRAQQAVLDLPDGSRVTLAADTRLRVPSNFARHRELRLDGRAYFVVVHDSTRPFRVATATATTEDIGTAFVITAYPESRGTHVVVTDGSVALRQPATAKPLLTLSRGDVATLDSNGTATLTRNADVERYLSWTKGVLSIDNTRLRDAIPELNRWYDVEIRLADASLGDRRVTAQLRSEPASRATERLALILGVKAHAVGRLITLSR